jgi:penicillin-binding protein 2
MIRILFLRIFIVITFLIFIFRLINLQLLNPNYETISNINAIIEISDYPERGLIYDRNLKLLVANQPVYDLMTVPENIKTFDTVTLANLLGISKQILENKILLAKRFSNRLPSIILDKIPKEKYALIQEHMWKFEGFFIQRRSIRDYKVNSGANFLGYISEVDKIDLNKNKEYELGELIGRQGIEKSYENILKGKKGKKFLQKDRFNRIIGSYNEKKFDIPKQNASNLILSIDSELQTYGEKIMKNKRGGIVAIEPSSGEVLALITSPSYDPKLLVGKDRSYNYGILAKDSISKPLFDRGLQAQYSPGSPFKVINALVALQEKVIEPNLTFNCNKGHYYAKNAFMKCHCELNTNNDLNKAIYNSCNTYFAKTFTKTIDKFSDSEKGLDQWKKHVESFGLGDYLGYDLPIGKKGFLPNSDYYNSFYKTSNWGATTIISNSIGQGEILTTPIQLANIAASIANRGFYYTPHFLKSSNSPEFDKVYTKKKTSIDSIHFETIIEGMFQVIEKGTAKIAKVKGIEICGKTGTAENFIKINNLKTQLTDHSIFMAFAPRENPKIAIAVFIENGYWGSRWAAPISSLIIEKYINKEIKRKWLENKIINGSLQNEYKKPYLGKPFKINE